jgi:hypothetical protein
VKRKLRIWLGWQQRLSEHKNEADLLEPHSRESKFAIGIGAIGLVVTLLLTSFHLSTLWTIISIIIIILGAAFVYFLPRLSQDFEFRLPIRRKINVREPPTAKETTIDVYDQGNLASFEWEFAQTRTEIWFLGLT